jgi:uncharacterized protein (TIGR02145 family)
MPERETVPELPNALSVIFDTLIDPRDGNVYRTVKIGNQVWMAENLRYKIEDSWCCYNDDANCQKYGRLYTWKAAKKACSAEWHLPSREEWRELVRAVDPDAQEDWDDNNVAGKKLKSITGWDENYGTDEYGFSALPCGCRYSGGNFEDVGYYGIWWTATEDESDRAYLQGMYYKYDNVGEGSNDKSNGYLVRCVKDN